MGKIEKGIPGGFSGKVGTVVGGNWRGIDYMRSKGKRSKAEPTASQLEQQAKFALAVRFAQSMSGLLNIGFSKYSVRQTGKNAALSYILKNAVGGVYPNNSILYANVQISRGDLPNVLAPAAAPIAGSKCSFSWTDNSGTGIAKPADKVMLAAYCSEDGRNIASSIYTGQLTVS